MSRTHLPKTYVILAVLALLSGAPAVLLHFARPDDDTAALLAPVFVLIALAACCRVLLRSPRAVRLVQARVPQPPILPEELTPSVPDIPVRATRDGVARA
jgi:hypothetical protein